VLSLAVGAGGEAHVFISQYSGARLPPRLRSEDLEGPIDSDSTVLAIGMAIESVLGPLPAPQL